MTKEIEEVKKGLPALADYVIGKVRTFDAVTEEEKVEEPERKPVFDKKAKKSEEDELF